MIVAYFIGGPWDLSKQILKGAMPAIEAPVVHTPISVADPRKAPQRVLYRLVAKCPFEQNGMLVVIYQAEGIL